MKILIDNGHGDNTPGKCSPDKLLREYKYCREIAKELVKQLVEQGYDAERIVTEDTDISLGERCRRVNKWCEKLGAKNVLLVSIHNNAAGNGSQWMNATGWTGWISKNASQNSKLLTLLLYKEAEIRDLKGNRSVPKEKYWTADYYILKNTNCPAVLTENLFLDNKEDVKFLLSDGGKKAIIELHLDGIKNYIKQVEKANS